MIRVLRKLPRLLALLLVVFPFPGQSEASSSLNFPRLSASPETLTGVAIVNPTAQIAQVTITAFDGAGDVIAESQIHIPAGRQAAVLTGDLFAGVDPGAAGWFRAESSTNGLTGFFLFLNTAGTQLDGADLPSPSRRIVFTQVGVGTSSSTELNLVNPGDGDVSAKLTLVADGGIVERTVPLQPRGAARLDVAGLFGVNQATPGAYILVEGNGDLIGFELLREAGADTVGANARVASQLVNSLFFPQIAVLGGIQSELTLINRSDQPVTATIAAHRPNGELFSTGNGESRVTRNLGPGEGRSEDLAELFGFEGEASLEGWLEVTAPTQALSGSLSYRLGSSGAAASVLPQSQGSTRAIFSHIATTLGFFTGVAGLNPGSLPADVRLVAVSADGRRLGSHDMVLRPGERFSRLLTDLIPDSEGQAGGFVFARSSVPIFLTSLFGTAQGSVLANIPPQLAPAGFSPDMGVPTVRVSPVLAAIPPSGETTFIAQSDVGDVDWSVDGGSPGEVGVIGADGVFLAPSTPPANLPITIIAAAGTTNSSGAVDVLTADSLVSTGAEVPTLAYLPGAGRIYVVQAVTLLPPAAPAGLGPSSVVFEVSAPDHQNQVALLAGETVSDMVAYRSDSGAEYLLLAGRTSGSVLRLDPSNGAVVAVATDLNAPSQLALDPLTGNLVVAETDRVSMLGRSFLEKDLAGPELAQTPPEPEVQRAVLFQRTGVAGIAVDECGGNIFFSDAAAGTVMEWVRSSGQVRETASGLSSPGQLTALYRRGVGCPFGLHLAVAQPETGDFALLVPRLGVSINPWFPGQGSDLVLAPGLTGPGTLLVGQGSDSGGSVLSLAASDLYRASPVNPPSIPAVGASSSPGPDLEMGSATLDGYDQVTLQVRFRPGMDDGAAGGPDQIGALVFSIDYDETKLDFDPSDADQDGIPDAIASDLPPGYSVFARFLPDRSQGEINLVIADTVAPLLPIPGGALVSLTFTIRESATGSADALFSTTPAPSAADLLARIHALDEAIGGTVTIVP